MIPERRMDVQLIGCSRMTVGVLIIVVFSRSHGDPFEI